MWNVWVWTHMYTIFILFSCKCHMLLLHWFSSSSLGNPSLLRTAEYVMVELREENTVERLAKERALLRKIRLCKHSQYKACRPPNGKPCNFAHWLQYLTVPEEMYGNWSKVWQQGEVDLRCWHSYHPNTESLDRFSWQFLFEKEVVARLHS